MKINKLAKPSRTEESYDEVKMDLFVPPGGKTRNWYVRVYIPAELRALYGKDEIRQSTRTTDRLMAKARAASFVLALSKEFLEKRQALRMSEGRAAKQVVLDNALIEKIAQIRLANLVRFDDEERDALDDEEQWQEHDDLIRLSLDDLKKIIARRKGAPAYERFQAQAVEFADVVGYVIELDDPMLPLFVQAMAKAETRAFVLMSRRSEGESVDLEPGESGPWLRELLEDWVREGAHHLPDKTRSSYTSRIESFVEFANDKLVAGVEKKDVWEWLNTLVHEHKLADKTISDGYLPALRSLFDYAVLSGKYGIRENPAKGIRAPKLSKREAASRERPREMFNTIYVNRIFSSEWYGGKSRPISNLRTPTVMTGNARYWVPLIGHFQGLRAEEVCQLTLVDVGMQSGVFSILISVDAGSVKNEDSERWVPVHKSLLELGFREYVVEDHLKLTQRDH